MATTAINVNMSDIQNQTQTLKYDYCYSQLWHLDVFFWKDPWPELASLLLVAIVTEVFLKKCWRMVAVLLVSILRNNHGFCGTRVPAKLTKRPLCSFLSKQFDKPLKTLTKYLQTNPASKTYYTQTNINNKCTNYETVSYRTGQ